MYDPFEDEEPENIQKVFMMGTGIKIYFRKIPPYGFWKISFERGELPEKLSGVYTSFKAAQKDAVSYLQTRRNPTEIKEKIEDWHDG